MTRTVDGHGLLPVLSKVLRAVKPGNTSVTFVPAQEEALS
jgi:hypothetical protein